MHFRIATPDDVEILAILNAQLILDEGHRNPMTVPELAVRMADWLRTNYQAAVFEIENSIVGYALFRRETDHVYLRQLFVRPVFRRQGIGRRAIAWLWRTEWQGAPRVRIDVLVGNTAGQAFWRSVGFHDYCLTMEMEPPE